MSIEYLQIYELYLKVITKQLDKFFEEQSPYIFCKEGCSICCEKGEYPFTEIEIKYLMVGFSQLPQNIQMQILKKTQQINIAKKDAPKDKKFMHECPFLIDKRCSVYNYRGLICRNHGLAFFDKDQKLCVPHCSCDGLNYASVYDFQNGCISKEKYEKTGFTVEPLAHNVGLEFLLNNSFTKENNMNFGEIKPLLDWLSGEP